MTLVRVVHRSIALAAGGAVVAQWAPASAAVLPRMARALGIPTTLPSNRGVLLTFDDGPHPQGTPAVLAALELERAPAVFFISGEQAVRHPEIVREIAAAGHELGVHGHVHQTRRQSCRRLLANDTRRALDAVSTAAGAMPRLYRPPHGVFTLTGLRFIRSLGLEPLLWSKWGRDWERGATASSIASHATSGIRAGDVLLLHDGDHYGAAASWRATAAAIPKIGDRIGAADLRPASVRIGPTPAGISITN
jgi:peptidoglycan/xylan/chitin deacetylase (PgdA/CDA1 family)